MDFADIQHSFLCQWSEFQTRKISVILEKNKTQNMYPAQCQGHGSGERGVLRLHMSARDMQKRWWWDGGEEMDYTSAFLSEKSSTSNCNFWSVKVWYLSNIQMVHNENH